MSLVMEIKYKDYLITDDKQSLTPEAIKALLDGSYWAPDRSPGIVARSIENSICVGTYLNKELVGFARVVTDRATFAWICDVVVSPTHREKGIGKRMMRFIQEYPDIPDTLQVLRTKDAHGLYEKFGFSKTREFMAK